MLKRRRLVLAVLAVAASVFLLPTSSASAATFPNACINSVTANNSQIGVTMTADAPASVAPGGSVTLSNINQSLAVPGTIFVSGYRIFLYGTGPLTVPATITTTIEGDGTAEGTQATNTVSATISTTIIDPTPANRNSGDETATPGQLDVTYADQTWTAGASGTINFREDTVTPLTAGSGGIVINALVGGAIPVEFDCSPGTVDTVPPAPPEGIITFDDPAASFATTTIQAVEPQRQISISNASATEGAAEDFTVSLDAASANPITVQFATANNTAVAPGDYTAATGTVTFAPGDTTKTVTVQTIDDTDVEGTETFVVNLTNATGNAAIADATGVGTILDNDVAEPQRKISINDVTKAEGNSGQTPFQFTVSLDAASAKPITVAFATANGTATAPSDYASNSGTVTFAPGDTSKTVTVQVNGDTTVEPNETFNVNLSNATGNATILDGTGVGTITNDDAVAGVDAAAKVLIAGKVFDLGKKDIKAYVIKVTNVGTSKITVNPRTDISTQVKVNGTVNGSVAVLPFTWRLDPGRSALIPALWTGNVVPGDSVEFIGCVNLAGDTNTANNCDSVTLIASALPHHGGHH